MLDKITKLFPSCLLNPLLLKNILIEIRIRVLSDNEGDDAP